jgi:hypothetical protein
MHDSAQLVRQLTKVVAAYTYFFDTCDDSELDDRTALKQMEYAGYLLNQLPRADKLRLIGELSKLAAVETDPAYREFLARFAFAAGLVDDEGRPTPSQPPLKH